MIRNRIAQLNVGLFGDIRNRLDRAIIEERYRALREQLPITFGVFLTNVLGLYAATARQRGFFDSPAWVLALIVLVRGGSLLRRAKQNLPAEEVQREFRRGLFAAMLYSLLYCRWAIGLFDSGGQSEQSFVALVATLSAIGCAYGFSAFPPAARIPLVLLGLPLGARLLVAGSIAQFGIGVSLLLMILLTHRMLLTQSLRFEEIVTSRSSIADERRRAEAAAAAARLEQANAIRIAQTDPLTGLANRRGLLAHLEGLSAAPWPDDRWTVLILVDLDGFKPINDTFGHAAGDAVLTEVAARLRASAAGAVACRLGGDEFAVVAIAGSEGEAAAIGEAIRASLSRPYFVQDRELRLSACCGIIAEPGPLSDPSLSLSRSDMALYKAKRSGRNCVVIFTEEMETRRIRRGAIERALRDPLAQDSVGLAFQPIFDLETMRPVSFEALARWRHPDLGDVPPMEFIRIAEEIDVIEVLGERLLRQAAWQASGWPAPSKLAFNLSAIQLSTESYAQGLLSIAAEAGLNLMQLQIEVTETALLADFEAARRTLEVFRSAGAEIVLDDFGAGYASLGYLREMRFDAVKLDGSIVDAALQCPSGERLMKGVLDLCRSLEVPCVAEHISSEAALDLAKRVGSKFGQGYYLCPPVSAKAVRLATWNGPLSRAA